MKLVCSCFSFVLLGVSAATAQFSQGNLAVLRWGNGSSGSLASTGAPIFVDQFTTSGSLVNTVIVPSSGANALESTGNATAEGALSLSADRQYLTFGAYNRAVGTGSGSPAATALPRVIGMVDYAGNFSEPALSSDASLNAMSFRTALADGQGNYWGMGNGWGTFYFGNNSSAGTVQSTYSVNRVMNSFNGSIYFSYGSSSQQGPGIYAFSGAPTGPSTPSLFLSTASGTGTASPYDFTLNASSTIMYVADDRTIANGGGIQRWAWNGTSWVLSYTLGTGSASTVGARGLAVDFSGASPLIYAVTAETTGNRLIEITDAGSGSSATTLTTAPANEIFRGLDFTPVQAVPEPSALAFLGVAGFGLLINRRRKN